MQRRDFLKLSCATAAAWPCGAIAPAASPSDDTLGFSFAHLTDIHVQPELDAAQGFRQCIAAVNQLNPRPDFVITGGDLIMDALAVGPDRLALQWKLFDECCKEFEVPLHQHDRQSRCRRLVEQGSD